MTDLTWVFFVLFLVSFVLFVVMASATIRLASRLTDTERKLKASKQAHGLDVASLGKKVYEQAQALTELKRSTHD